MEKCIFCKIVKGDIPSKKVYEDDKILCFKDISPAAPIHIIIIPKTHMTSMNSLNSNNNEIISHIFLKAVDVAKELGIESNGYRMICNCGEDGGQTVNHLHFHLLGGRRLSWPPG